MRAGSADGIDGSVPAVQVRGLTKAYAGRRVVDDLDLEVPTGSIIGLIGANGAGKTTTVECLQGLRRPDAGHLRVLGLDPQRDADRLRPLVGSQLQSSGLPDRLRVGEAVALFRAPRSVEADPLLERFGLADKRRAPFAGLSGGERQRLFLVLALLGDPRLVILDELTQGLDPAARREVWAAVGQLRDDGVTVLLVTHELGEVELPCDAVVAMRDGRVVDEGTPTELVERHVGGATIEFGLTAPPTAAQLDALRRLPEVQRVEPAGRRVTVVGRRAAVAHVGGWLLGLDEPVPADLRVEQPGLEDALLVILGLPTGSAA